MFGLIKDLEGMWSSEVGVLIALSLALIYVVIRNRRLERENRELYERLIHWLELRNAEIRAEYLAGRSAGNQK